jgi:hypothetical protein
MHPLNCDFGSSECQHRWIPVRTSRSPNKVVQPSHHKQLTESLKLPAKAVLAAVFAATAVHAAENAGPLANDAVTGRQAAVLKKAAAENIDQSSDMRQITRRAVARYWLDQDTAAADKAIILAATPESRGVTGSKFASDEANADRYFSNSYFLQRVYFLFYSRSEYFPGRMGKAAEDAIAKATWDLASKNCKKKMVDPDHIWWVPGTENLAARKWASYWGAAQILAEHPDYRDRQYADGTPVQEMARAFDDHYKLFAREWASKGLMVEVNSAYNDWALNAWYNVADFARDPLTRQRMKMYLDVWWADWAIEQIDGVRGGSRHRCYPGVNSQAGTGAGGDAVWYLFGMGEPSLNMNSDDFGAATTFYRPAPIIYEWLSASQRGTYAYVSRRPGIGTTKYEGKAKATKPADAYDANVLMPEGGNLLRYTFCTPDYVIGTSMVPALPLDAWTNISSQNRWEGVIFAGNRTARIFVQPEAADGKHYYNASWSVQNKGVMIVQRLRTAQKAKGQRIWFDASLNREERDGWIFADAPQAYAAVRIVNGDNRWESDSSRQRPGKKVDHEMGQWLKCVDDFSPIIIEVARKSDFPDFREFQESILANPLRWQNQTLDYRSNFHQTALTFYADYSKPPLVDGVPVNYAPKKAYDSPYIQGDFGSGVVTLWNGEQKQVLDFND